MMIGQIETDSNSSEYGFESIKVCNSSLSS